MQRFELLGRNGAGANSTVFKCRDIASGRIVAVKKFEGATLPEIVQEAAIMRACAHKHCVALLEAHQGAVSGVAYLVMEHVEHSLSRELLLNPRGLPLPKAKLVTFQLATALELVHSKKVVHGDLKPANVLLTAQYKVKLCDFGSASSTILDTGLANGGADGACTTRAVLPCPSSLALGPKLPPKFTAAGSRWYCAPESLLGGDRSEASDIWALGCILGELVTGKPLMPGGENELDQLCCVASMIGGLSEAQEELLRLLPWEQRVKLNQARAKAPMLDRIPKIAACPALSEVLRACLQPDPGCRPTAQQLQAMAFFDDLRQALLAAQIEAAAAAGNHGAVDAAPRARRTSSGSMDVDSPAEGAGRSPDSVEPCPAAAAVTATSEPGAASCAPAAAAGACLLAAQPQRRTGGVQAAAPVRPVSRARVSALTATIRGNPFEGDGGYVDLMPQALSLAAKWEEPRECQVLGPIAMAAQRICSSSTSPEASLPSPPGGEVPIWGARLTSGALAAALAVATPSADVEAAVGTGAVCTTPIAAAAGGCGADRTLETKVTPRAALPGAASPMDCAPAAPEKEFAGAAGAAASKPTTPLSASVGAVPYMARASGVLPCSGASGLCAAAAPNAAAANASISKTTPAQLRSRAILNRARRNHSRETRAGSVPSSFMGAHSPHGGLGSSATIMQRELAAAAAPTNPPPVAPRQSDLQRAACHTTRRSFADLSELASVAEYEALHCEASPDVKRRRGLLSHAAYASQPSAGSLSSPITEASLGSLPEWEPMLFLGARATMPMGGGSRRMRRSSSGISLATASPVRPAGWQQLLPAGAAHEASLPQPIAGRSRYAAAPPARGLASSVSSDVHNSVASDTFLREVA